MTIYEMLNKVITFPIFIFLKLKMKLILLLVFATFVRAQDVGCFLHTFSFGLDEVFVDLRQIQNYVAPPLFSKVSEAWYSFNDSNTIWYFTTSACTDQNYNSPCSNDLSACSKEIRSGQITARGEFNQTQYSLLLGEYILI